jgi:hypothetical protein
LSLAKSVGAKVTALIVETPFNVYDVPSSRMRQMSEAFTQHAEQISRHAAPNSSEEKAGVLDFRAMPGEVSGWE